MVEYLKSTKPHIASRLRTKFETANSIHTTAQCWYQILFRYFLNNTDPTFADFLVGPFMEKIARVPGRRFPMVEHAQCSSPIQAHADEETDGARGARWTRVILVEVMEPRDPELSWDVRRSDVYEELREMDKVHPEAKSLGALTAGSNFVLFEITGRNDPVFLVGEPTKLGHFIEDADALERAICDIRDVAVLGGCKCPDIDLDAEPGLGLEEGKCGLERTDDTTIDDTGATTPPHLDSESTSSTSGETNSLLPS